MAEDNASAPKNERYGWYVLGVLTLVYALNFIDRQILSILANDIKRDLHLSDADLGFLYGTAFGVFYALFGIPLGRLADSWNRTRLLTIGLALWSTMTALSGFARNGMQLSLARIGVGIGEATASPSAYSLLSDWFPREKRATALAIYSSGLYLGGGFSLMIGSSIVGRWNALYPHGGPLGLVGWQAAFLAVGIPGLIVALWVTTLKEPIRGRMDGMETPPSERPFAAFFEELMSVVPPLTLISAARRGSRAIITNIVAAGAIALLMALLIKLVGDSATSRMQWAAFGLGVYAVYSWATNLRERDPPTFTLIWKTPALLSVVFGYGLIAFLAYAVSFWSAPYAERVLHASKAEAAWWVGGPGALAGFLGVILGGRMADHFRRTNPGGRILVALFGAIAPILPFIITFTTTSKSTFYAMHFVMGIFTSSALGACAATVQDLVLPRMRGLATATFLIGATLVGLSLGPYFAGYLSAQTGSLATGLLSLLAIAPITLILLVYAYRTVPKAEASIVDRARAAGEDI